MSGDARREEKVELSLEQRQVTILAVSALILLGVVFALGVLVGRQLASAAIGAPSQPPVGDLRALDAAKPAPPPPAIPAPVVPNAPTLSAAPSAAPSIAAPVAPAPPPVAAKPAAAASEHAAVAPSHDELEQIAEDDEVAVVPAPKSAVVAAAPKPVTVAAAKEPQAPLPPPPAKLGKFTVQLASTTDRKDAQRLEARARGLGLKPYITAVHLGAKGTWYRVRAGAFDKRDEATAYQKDVERELHCNSAVMPSN